MDVWQLRLCATGQGATRMAAPRGATSGTARTPIQARGCYQLRKGGAAVKDRPARPGKPGTYGGHRLRWRHVTRAARAADRPAVRQLAEAEQRMAEKYTRSARRAVWVRNLMIAGGALALLFWRCAT
jgi:hypothetical protein